MIRSSDIGVWRERIAGGRVATVGNCYALFFCVGMREKNDGQVMILDNEEIAWKIFIINIDTGDLFAGFEKGLFICLNGENICNK